MDNAVTIPVIGKRVGLDAVIGLIPYVGECLTTQTASWQLFASGCRVSRAGYVVLGVFVAFQCLSKAPAAQVQFCESYQAGAGVRVGPCYALAVAAASLSPRVSEDSTL